MPSSKRPPPRWTVQISEGTYRNRFDDLAAAERCAKEQSQRNAPWVFLIRDLRGAVTTLFYAGQQFIAYSPPDHQPEEGPP